MVNFLLIIMFSKLTRIISDIITSGCHWLLASRLELGSAALESKKLNFHTQCDTSMFLMYISTLVQWPNSPQLNMLES